VSSAFTALPLCPVGKGVCDADVYDRSKHWIRFMQVINKDGRDEKVVVDNEMRLVFQRTDQLG
jgi:hypothetical protein